MDDGLDAIAVTKCWLEKVVLGLNLCPFAHLPFKNQRIRYTFTNSDNEKLLLDLLQHELLLLNEASSEDIETTLLIHPKVLSNFFDYNDFLDLADDLLDRLELTGIIQIASFHPDYQFSGTVFTDVENYTNRSPYPMLHLIREASLERVLASYPDPENIPERNIARMEQVGESELQLMIANCSDVDQIQ